MILLSLRAGVQCHYLPCRHRKDWELGDPTGKSEEDLFNTANIIKGKMAELSKFIFEH